MNIPDHELDLVALLPANPLQCSKQLHQVAVYLYRAIDLISRTGVSHYDIGPALVPSDLARLIYRNKMGIPLKSHKPTPTPKSSKH